MSASLLERLVADWLREISQVLDKASSPVRFFFRDDDAGWENDKLFNMLDKFAQNDVAIDLALIPKSLDNQLADELMLRWRNNKQLLGLHQHGYGHINHEQNGRKCEFGSSRTKVQQQDDLAEGKACLQACFGLAFDPFFTPPWNRCTQDTVECLEDLDFKLLSRDITATQFDSTKIQHRPVHIDWSKIIKQSSCPEVDLAHTLSQHFASNELTGIMLHHADMGNGQIEPLTELLVLLASHHNAQGLLLRDTLN
jgi:predicted deacetylase